MFDWTLSEPVTFETVLSQFEGCEDIDAIKQKGREIIKTYYPENCKETDPYTPRQCTQIIGLVNEVIKRFEDNVAELSQLKDVSTPTVTNYSAYRSELYCTKWDDIWNFDLEYGQNVMELFKRFVLLPDQEIQLPILASICCFNTALNNISFNLEIYSRKPGSGKSTVAEIISALQGTLKNNDSDTDGMSQAGTFAAERNFIQMHRYFRTRSGEIMRCSQTHKLLEKNLFLILDDFPKAHLKVPDYYTLLKAYKRSSAYIRKSERQKNPSTGVSEDVIISFPIFCVKVLTACYSIFSEQQYSELARRTFFIKCAPLEDFIETLEVEDIPEDLLKPSEVNWRGISDLYYAAWNEEASQRYSEIYRALKKPQTLSVAQWEISKGMLASGITLGVFESMRHALASIKNYWDWFYSQKIDSRSPIENVLEQAILDWQEQCSDPILSASVFPSGKPNPFYPMHQERISPLWIELALKNADKNSELDKKPSAKVRGEAMESIGWRLRRYSGKSFWMPID